MITPAQSLNEFTVETIALSWFADLGYEVRHGEEIAPGEPAAERDAYDQVVLLGRLRDAVERLNPKIPADAREEAIRKVLYPESPSLVANNRKFHAMLRDGVEVEYQRPDGSIAGDRVRLIDFADPDNNDWLVVNQFTVVEAGHNRRADTVVFVNGLPLGVLELKNPGAENATIWDAYTQLQTYKQQIPSLFLYNETLVVSDGLTARVGSLTANKEWFKPWRTIDGDVVAPATLPELEVLVKGLFDQRRHLEFLRNFVAFEEDPHSEALIKILAGYHQFHAVQQAVERDDRLDDPRIGPRQDPGDGPPHPPPPRLPARPAGGGDQVGAGTGRGVVRGVGGGVKGGALTG